MSPIRTDGPDLLGPTLMHRLMRTDLHRLTTVAADIAAGRSGCSDRRARAVAGWCKALCDEIHHHLAADDMDLAALGADHRGLDPLLDAVRAAVAGLEMAAEPARLGPAAELATRLARVRDAVDAHPDVAERVRHGGPGLWFTLPRLAAAATPAEWARFRAEAGTQPTLLAGALRPALRRRTRLVFG